MRVVASSATNRSLRAARPVSASSPHDTVPSDSQSEADPSRSPRAPRSRPSSADSRAAHAHVYNLAPCERSDRHLGVRGRVVAQIEPNEFKLTAGLLPAVPVVLLMPAVLAAAPPPPAERDSGELRLLRLVGVAVPAVDSGDDVGLGLAGRGGVVTSSANRRCLRARAGSTRRFFSRRRERLARAPLNKARQDSLALSLAFSPTSVCV